MISEQLIEKLTQIKFREFILFKLSINKMQKHSNIQLYLKLLIRHRQLVLFLAVINIL